MALNYLVRYFYLIVFANYLLEEMGNLSMASSMETASAVSSSTPDMEVQESQDSIVDEDARKMTTFNEWLKGRREIINILKLQAFDLS